MQSIKGYTRFVEGFALASVVGMFGIQPLFAETTNFAATTPDTKVRDDWRVAMSHNPASEEGCYEASYPSLVWERVECEVGEPQVRPVARTAATPDGGSEVTGNGHDYALEATGLITAAQGQFPVTKDIKTEKGVGVAAFGGGGILGPNEYTLQLNSNDNHTTSVCAGHSGCTIWQQYVYAPDYITKGKAAVFIQYWLLNWGNTKCPTGWQDAGGSCVKNSASVAAPDLAITDIGNMALEGQAAAGGNDVITFYNGKKAYTVTTKDSVLKLGTVWTEAEFNVVGNAGGSRAVFNTGAGLLVLIQVADGSTSAPYCLSNAGSTGETNNLNLQNCEIGTNNGNPAIEFTEAN